MAADPARIGFIQNQFRKVASETAAIKTRFGALARESEDPIETFFDSAADAQVVVNQRQALLGADRRRFRVSAVGVDEVMSLAYLGAVPVATLVDPDKNASLPVLVSEIIIDLNRDSSLLRVWG